MTEEPHCCFCGKTQADAAIEEESWDLSWQCTDRKACVPWWEYTPRRRTYAKLTTEMLDRLECEAEKQEYETEIPFMREISGPELLSLIRLARRVEEWLE